VQIKLYKKFPEEARVIRQRVFVEEQGFTDEFDETDSIALHLVAFDGGCPAGTCRIFWDEQMGMYVLGRLAVLEEYRGQGVGAQLVYAAERQTDRLGGRELYLHAQCAAADFYKKQGYRTMGEVEPEQGCPHIWMLKQW